MTEYPIEREGIEEALENDRCGICLSVEHFREDCTAKQPPVIVVVTPTWRQGVDWRREQKLPTKAVLVITWKNRSQLMGRQGLIRLLSRAGTQGANVPRSLYDEVYGIVRSGRMTFATEEDVARVREAWELHRKAKAHRRAEGRPS